MSGVGMCCGVVYMSGVGAVHGARDMCCDVVCVCVCARCRWCGVCERCRCCGVRKATVFLTRNPLRCFQEKGLPGPAR